MRCLWLSKSCSTTSLACLAEQRGTVNVGGALGRRPGFLNIMPGGRGPEAPPTRPAPATDPRPFLPGSG